jgi:hypothetical protein
MEQTVVIERTVKSLFHSPDWKRLKLHIANATHDADREILVKQIRLLLIADLTTFRAKK